MGKHKTTLLVDAEVWRRFHEEVVRHEGGRSVSGAVERLLRGPDRFREALEMVFPPSREGYPSLAEVEADRPSHEGDAAAGVRRERDDRADRLS